MNKVMQLCYRSIIQHVAGDIKKAKKYKDMAIDEHERSKSIVSIGEILSEDLQKRLYRLVG